MCTDTAVDGADSNQRQRDFDAQREWHFGLHRYTHVIGMREIDRTIRRAVLDPLFWDPDVAQPHEDTFRRTRLLSFLRTRRFKELVGAKLYVPDCREHLTGFCTPSFLVLPQGEIVRECGMSWCPFCYGRNVYRWIRRVEIGCRGINSIVEVRDNQPIRISNGAHRSDYFFALGQMLQNEIDHRRALVRRVRVAGGFAIYHLVPRNDPGWHLLRNFLFAVEDEDRSRISSLGGKQIVTRNLTMTKIYQACARTMRYPKEYMTSDPFRTAVALNARRELKMMAMFGRFRAVGRRSETADREPPSEMPPV